MAPGYSPGSPTQPLRFREELELEEQALPRQKRLSRSREIEEVMRSGIRRRGRVVEVIVRRRGDGPARAAVVVGRMGQTLVRRNRVKRRLREVARRAILPSCEVPIDLILRARPQAYEASFRELRDEALRLWKLLRGELEHPG